MIIFWIIIILIISYAAHCIGAIVVRRHVLSKYMQQWNKQLNLFGLKKNEFEKNIFNELKNISSKKLSAMMVAENIFSNYKFYLLQKILQKDPALSKDMCIDYLKTITLKEFVDCTIPTGDKLVDEIKIHNQRVSHMKEINMNKICEHLAKHHQTANDFEIASRALDKLEPYIQTDKELSDEEASILVDRWAKEKALRKKFDDFCDNYPETKKVTFKRENFWKEIKRVLYKVDSKGVQYQNIDALLSDDNWWMSELNRYTDLRKTEAFRENEEFQRLKREVARVERDARYFGPPRRW